MSPGVGSHGTLEHINRGPGNTEVLCLLGLLLRHFRIAFVGIGNCAHYGGDAACGLLHDIQGSLPNGLPAIGVGFLCLEFTEAESLVTFSLHLVQLVQFRLFQLHSQGEVFHGTFLQQGHALLQDGAVLFQLPVLHGILCLADGLFRGNPAGLEFLH